MGSESVYGYARVSAKTQSLNRQIDALKAFPIDELNIYSDKASGRDFERPRYKALIKKLKPGDTVVIKSIDRLGRNYNEILDQWRILTKEKNASIVVLDMPLLDTRKNKNGITGVFIADLVLQLLSYIAQVERENIKQRQAEGIAAAQARGVRFGRPPVARPKDYGTIKNLFLRGKISRKEAAEKMNVSITTFSNWLKADSNNISNNSSL